jgi:hypothetical protein
MEHVLNLVELFLFCLGSTYLGAWAIVAVRGNRGRIEDKLKLESEP